MKKKSKFLRVLKQEYKMSMSYELSHISKFLASAVGGIISTILFSMLWLASTDLGYDGLSKEYVISYFLLVLITSKLTMDVSIKLVTDSIVTGRFSKYLTKPFSYLTEAVGANLAEQTLHTIFTLPVIIPGALLLQDYLSYDLTPYTIFLFLCSIVIANAIKFLMAQIFSLIAFTVKQMYGLRNLHQNLVVVFSGEIIPYAALPAIFTSVLELTPFRYVLSFPVEILLGGMRPYDINTGFLIAGIWIIFLYLIYKVGYILSVKKYEAEGI
jgi:ABC-2 type transport system permease protein